MEFYGGLGSTLGFGLNDTAHYVAPVIAWMISRQRHPPFLSWVRTGSRKQPRAFEIRLQLRNPGDGQEAVAAFWREAMKRLGFWAIASAFLWLHGAAGQNTNYQPDASWRAPLEAASRLNPLANRPQATAGGRKLFFRNCAECHDQNGSGIVKKHSADFQLPMVQEQSDGTLFWKITNGNPDRGMPSFSRLPELERWQLVLFLRTLRPVEPLQTGSSSSRGAETP